jgi:nucleotide-binding universal stress UspA family protein
LLEQEVGQVLRDYYLGSIASSVVSYAHCPVMVVK